MLEGFEDAFVDAQARSVSLCIELLASSDIDVEYIYIYIFQNDVQDYFNAFFQKDGNLFMLNDLFPDEQIYEFLGCGIEDVENIIDVCNIYDGKCPNEFKLIYNTHTKAFDSEYKYEDYISEDCGVVETFENWFNECKEKL